jgi:uncharacterized protein
VFNFLPKADKFLDQLDNLARMLVSAAQQLSAILQTFRRFDPQKHEIEELRKKAADVAQNSLAMLDHAFITPLDREDILALIDGMNDVIASSKSPRWYSCHPAPSDPAGYAEGRSNA